VGVGRSLFLSLMNVGYKEAQHFLIELDRTTFAAERSISLPEIGGTGGGWVFVRSTRDELTMIEGWSGKNPAISVRVLSFRLDQSLDFTVQEVPLQAPSWDRPGWMSRICRP
jgi:hypothetical protein